MQTVYVETKKIYIDEAAQIGHYLLGVPVNDSEKETYAEAMGTLNIQLSQYERSLWQDMLRSRSRMAYIDAGLAFSDPGNKVRRKLFTMLAILEASPAYTSFFLPRNFSSFYIFKVMLAGARAVFRTAIGILIVNKIKRQCS